MAKLFPPYINGTIPAFEGTTMVVPFSMNKAVAKAQVKGFCLKVKTVSGVTLEIVKEDIDNIEDSVQFSIDRTLYKPGQYYKIQIAYVDYTDTVGYYSTVGVIKYTTLPSISLEKMSIGKINSHLGEYIGKYSQYNKDTTEKLHSSRFWMTDLEGNIIVDSGYVLHNVTNDDTSYEAIESFKITRDLELDKIYYMYFAVRTSNDLEMEVGPYLVSQDIGLDPYLTNEFVAEMDFDEGCVNVHFAPGPSEIIEGNYVISRADTRDVLDWKIMKYIDAFGLLIDKFYFKDFTVEHGVEYIYSIQQINVAEMISNRILTNPIYVDYEDMFLYDGKRQLKVRYNPKMGTYKPDVLDTKTDTIGSKYPFITRNGYVNYKEFAISGLLSFNSDMEKNFMIEEEKEEDMPIRPDTPGNAEDAKKYTKTDLSSFNIQKEKEFKNKVIDWLSNGEPKLLRTPTEGNFLVRLMNVTTSPEEKLGRMLHNFSASAYEIGYPDPNSLTAAHIIDNTRDGAKVLKSLVSFTDLYELAHASSNVNLTLMSNVTNVTDLFFKDLRPGTEIEIKLCGTIPSVTSTGEYTTMKYSSKNPMITSLMIGATGNYHYKVDPRATIVSVKMKRSEVVNRNSSFEYFYKSTKPIQYINGLFDILDSYDSEVYSVRQFIGNYGYNSEKEIDKDLFSVISDIKTEVSYVNFIRFYKRPVYELFIKLDNKGNWVDNIYYEDMNCTDPFTDFQSWALYRIRAKLPEYSRYKDYTGVTNIYGGYYLDAMNKIVAPYGDNIYSDYQELDKNGNVIVDYSVNFLGFKDIQTGKELLLSYDKDSNKFKKLVWDENLFAVNYNDSLVDLYYTDGFEINSNVRKGKIYVGDGVISEISYLATVKNYMFPESFNKMIKKEYDIHLDILWNNYITYRNTYFKTYETANGLAASAAQGTLHDAKYWNKATKTAYDRYIIGLEKALVLFKNEFGLFLNADEQKILEQLKKGVK